MEYESKTTLVMSCRECENCYLCSLDNDIYCKHPFVVSPVERRPEWCLSGAQDVVALAHPSESDDPR